MKIQILPEHLIDQIKAGEVIERPAHLLKEVMENSLDAQATSIEITLVNNGLELISVKDNGHGIAHQQLPLAFARHATSKITSLEELSQVRSFGFRGEALASMASISKLTCRSFISTDQGSQLEFHGPEQKHHVQLSEGSKGTVLTVKELFFNTPARLKFMRSQTSEKNALKRMLSAFFLSNPQVSFAIKWDQHDKLFFPACDFSPNDQQYLKRLQYGFLKKSSDAHRLIPVQTSHDYYTLKGLLNPFDSRQSYLFVNGRLFADKQIHSIGTQLLRQFNLTGSYLLFFTVPPEHLDVNVHPNKTFVKFHDSPLILALLTRSLKEALTQTQEQPASTIIDSAKQIEIPLSKDNESLHSLSIPTTTPVVSSVKTQSKAIELISLTPHYAFFFFQQKSYLLSRISYFKKILQDQWKVFFPEEKTVPLLVSEPFTFAEGALDYFLSEFKTYGLDLDRLSPELLVLRSWPEFFNLFSAKEFLQDFFAFLNQNPSKNLKAALQGFLEELKSDYQLTIESLLSQADFTQLLQQKIITALTEEKIELLFS